MKAILFSAATLMALSAPVAAQDAGQVDMIDRAGWFEDPSRLSQSGGQQVYDAICAACHMPDGQGAVGAAAYPALAGNDALITPDYPIYVIVQGHKAMPPLGGILDDRQVADVVNYIRTSFGNSHADDPATPERVADAR